MKKYSFIKITIAICMAVPLVTYITGNFSDTEKNYLIASLVGTISMLVVDEFCKLFMEDTNDN